MAAEQPQPPERLPKYFAEGVPKQDDSTLRGLQGRTDKLIEYRADTSADEIEVSEKELLEAIDDTGETTTVIEKVPCGRESCSTCPHRPYRYGVHDDGGSLVWDHKGAVNE